MKEKLKHILGGIGRFFKKIGKFLWKKKIWVIIALVIIGCVCAFRSCQKKQQELLKGADTNVVVSRMDIEEKITGSTTIQPKDEYSISPLVTGEILDAPFEEGDIVDKGDIMYVIDSDTMSNSIESADIAIQKAKKAYEDAKSSHGGQTTESSLKSAEIAYQKAQNAYQDALDAKDDLYVKPLNSGTVRTVEVKAGESVNVGTKIAEIYNSEDLELRVPFNASDAAGLSSGQQAVVTLTGSGRTLYGTVTEVSSSNEAQNGYMVTRQVKITVQNPGALTEGDTATAMVGDIACNDVGTFYNLTDDIITAKAAGTIDRLNITAGDRVTPSTTVAVIHSEAVESQIQSAKLSVDDAEQSYNRAKYQKADDTTDTTISNAKLTYDDAVLAKEKLLKQLEDYTVKAPISGTVVTKNKKKGDKIEAGGASSMSSASSASSASVSASSSALAVIYDMSTLELSLDVDELDVKNVSVGQQVKITVDASDHDYSGIVNNVSVNGTVGANGVSTYPVKVIITDPDDKILPGMNVEAEITVRSVKNVLAVPVNALNRGDIVYVQGEKEDEKDKAPEGYKSVQVTTGASDDEYIQVTSGLEEGDTVYSKPVEQTNPYAMMMGGPGMSGGGHPDGGGGGM